MAKEVEAKAADINAAKLKALQATIDKIEKDYGKGTIMKLGEQPQWDVQVIPSGSVALDHALGIGGYPRGRIVEIYGPESSGKTTVLRDLCRRLSGKYRVSLIDERGELAAVSDGRAVNDIGSRTDVFTGYPKLTAIMTAVRVMDPQVLICDEVGAGDELSAYRYAVNSGVKVIATCHASSLDELLKRPVISELIRDNAFDKAVFLGSGNLVGRMLSCHRFGEKLCSGFSAV